MMRFLLRQFFILFIALFSVVVTNIAMACMDETAGTKTMLQRPLQLVTDAGKKIPLDVLVADDKIEQVYGFQYICSERIDQISILFVFNTPTKTGFHMRNVYAPLDIGFFNDQGVLQQVLSMYPYGSHGEKKVYMPEKPFKYALEVRADFFKKYDIHPGQSKLVFPWLFKG